MVNRTLVKNGRKNKNIIVVMFICLLFLTVALLPNISLAFSTSAIATFKDIGDFPILTFEQNVTQLANLKAPGPVSASKLDISDVYLQISLNENIPTLLLSIANGLPIDEVTINFDGSSYSIKLIGVKISSTNWTDTEGFSGFQIGLSFGKIYWTYGSVTTGWDYNIGEPL